MGRLAWLGALWLWLCLSGTPSAAHAEPRPDIVMWGKDGCPHCRDAHAYLQALRARRPRLTIREHDVQAEPGALDALRAASRAAGLDVVGLPSFTVRGALVVGFDSAEGTGKQIERLLDAPATEPSQTLELPGLGQLRVSELGLPAFTIVVGLVDGFNPCAMWVLLFLLALLVNVRSRARMLAIAGCFVLVSGLAYYAFMAAWLSAFELIGISRTVQVALGLLALGIGAVNIKDFFAFGRGLSLAIPESAKPGIYARVRAIVRAENLTAALLGATTLAVLVNVVELLCTAGLPALYTQVLLQQGLDPPARHAYLALYVLSYMFDDSIMVGVAVITLGRRKLQERGGRWLKLLSGVTIALLGLLLIVAPQALVW